MKKQYLILKDGSPLVVVDDIDVAMQMIRNLEAKMDRYQSHSPYTLEAYKE